MILSIAHFLLHCEAAVRGRLLVPVLEASLPWTMHHHHVTRQVNSNSYMTALLDHFLRLEGLDVHLEVKGCPSNSVQERVDTKLCW